MKTDRGQCVKRKYSMEAIYGSSGETDLGDNKDMPVSGWVLERH